MICPAKRYLTSLLGLCAGVFAASAETYHWSGTVDGAWTNPANWVEGAVPGRVLDGTGATVGQTGDVAVFGDTLTGRAVTTIDLTGVYSIAQVLTEGTHVYTYGTTADQYVPLEPFGVFSAAESAATPVAVLQAKLRLGVELMATNWGGEMTVVRNNSTQEFKLGAWGEGTRAKVTPGGGGEPAVCLEGSGDIRLTQSIKGSGAGGYVLCLRTSGLVIVDAVQSIRRFGPIALAGDTRPQRVEITARGSIEPYSCYNWLQPSRALVVSGEGPFKFGSGVRSGADVVCETTTWQPMTFNCPIEAKFINGTPSDDCPRLFISAGGGLLTFAGENRMQGIARVMGSSIISADAFGLRGTYGRLGDMDFILGSGPTLRYTGAGETMDRTLTLTNQTAGASGAAQLEQMGTGPWTVTSQVLLGAGRTAGQLTLKGTASYETATFAGTLAEGISIQKTDSGTWTFAPQNAFTGAVSVNGGTFRFGNSQHIASLTASANGSTMIGVAEGCTIEIDAVTATTDRKLDFILEANARVKIGSGTAGAGLAGVTINGHPAVLDDDLNLVMAEISNANLWKSAVSGTVDDPSNWMGDTLPNLAQDTFIDAAGGDYTVTLDGIEMTTTNIIAHNHGSGTVTLLVTNGAVLNVQGHTTTDPLLRLGKGAKLEVVDATVRVKDQGNATGYISSKSSTSLDHGSEVVVRGNSSFITRAIVASEMLVANPNNLNTFFDFAAHSVVFDDDAVFTTEYESTKPPSVFYHTFRASRAGTSTRTLFKGRSHLGFVSAPWTLTLGGNGSLSVLEFDTAYDKQMTGWSCMQIGNSTGIGELRILRGNMRAGGWGYLWLATTGSDMTTSSGLVSTGRVVIAEGGRLEVPCESTSTTSFNGVQLGHGTSLTKARGGAYVYGEMQLAGTYQQNRGMFLVGTGPNGAGLVRQTGGEALVVVDPSVEVATTRGEVGIGVFGGTGRYELTGGAFTTGHSVFIGGAFTNDLRRQHVNIATLNQYHDARGTLAVSGGSFTAAKEIVLGRDGTGVLELTGDGRVGAAKLVVSNTVGQAASGIRFTVDAERRCGTIDPATKLVFHAGSFLKVDVTAVATQANPRRVVVWNLDASPEVPDGLDALNVVLTGAERLHLPNRLELSADGRTLAWNVTTQTVILLR